MEEKTVFITGGSKGIGKALVETLAPLYRQVIFTFNTDKESAEKISGKFSNCSACHCDLRDTGKAETIAASVLASYGQIDVLINNAGYDKDAVFTKMGKESWDDVIDVNLKSIYNFTHHFLPGMIDKHWGRIINLTSIAGFAGAFGKSNYAAAKAGIAGFTKSLALEVASKDITVNAVAPGAIDTAMFMRIPQKYRDKILEDIPAGRPGKPEEVASLIKFLISRDAGYITGQTIHINGGSFLF